MAYEMHGVCPRNSYPEFSKEAQNWLSQTTTDGAPAVSWIPEAPLQPCLTKRQREAYKQDKFTGHRKGKILVLSDREASIKSLTKNFYADELRLWCLRFDRIGFRVGSSTSRGNAPSCASLIFDLCKLVLEWIHLHRSSYLTGSQAEFAYHVHVPSNHRCAFTLHDLYPGRVYPLPRASSSGVGVANQQPDTGSRASSPSDEEISPTSSVRDIAQRFQETGGKRPVAPRQEDLRRKGISWSTVVEEQETSAAAAVLPIDMKKVRQHNVAADKECERCATISPASFWNPALCPSFMGS